MELSKLLIGLLVLMGMSSLFAALTLVLMRSIFASIEGRWFYWLGGSVLAAAICAVLIAALVLATGVAHRSALSVVTRYFFWSWPLTAPAILVMWRRWRSRQLPNPAQIFE